MNAADAQTPVRRGLFVTHNAPRFAGDAAGSFVLRLATALRSQGVTADIVAPANATMRGIDIVEGISIERVIYASPSRMTLAYSGTMAEDVRASWGARIAFIRLIFQMSSHVRRRLRTAARSAQPYDVVHAHWWFPAGLSANLAGVGASLRVPLVITMHGSDVRLVRNIPVAQKVMQWVLGRALVVTAVSKWLANTAMQFAPAARVEVGPMPVDTSVFVPPTANTERKDILFVGRLNEQKGIADLLGALALISDSAVALDVVGDGPDAASLRAKASTLGIADRIRWHGALSQPAVVGLYQRASVVAIPSREEGLGLVAVEAQLCATPVVAYSSGGLVDVVLPEHGGSLIEPGNIAALAKALEAFTSSRNVEREHAQQCGTTARIAMLDRFSPEVVARKYCVWYDQAVHGRR